MNPIILLLAILFCLSCKSPHTPTYKEGLDRCSEILEKKKKDYPGRIIGQGPKCIVGSSLPEFMAQTLSGEVIDHNYFIGKISLINFWFETCAPCVAEIPALDRLVDKYGKEKFNYLAFGRDKEEDIEIFLKDHPWRFEQARDGANIYDTVFEQPWGYPTTLVINKKGVIVGAFTGLNEKSEVEIQHLLDNLL